MKVLMLTSRKSWLNYKIDDFILSLRKQNIFNKKEYE